MFVWSAGEVVVVLEVDRVPLGPDERSALVWKAGGVVVLVLNVDGVPVGPDERSVFVWRAGRVVVVVLESERAG